MSVLYIRDKNGDFVPVPALQGEDGGYYVPHVDDEGNLSWAASEVDMPSIASVNIKGKDGENGKSGVHVDNEEPTDPSVNVWIDPDGEPDGELDEYYTKAQTDEAIEEATNGKADQFTVGDGLTISEDRVLSAVGEGEGVYELIETITTEEDTLEIVRTQDPDGTPYNYKAFAFRFTAPQTSMIAGLHMRAHASEYEYIDIAMPSLSGGDIRKTTVFVYDKFGYWYADGYMPSVSYSNSNISFALAPNYINRIPSSKPMIKLWISVYGTEGVVIPAGTTIEIWGVRANA